MLIPVNIKLKHWILACIYFEQKRISWYDSIREVHQERVRLLFAWLTREHSFNRTGQMDHSFWTSTWHADPTTNQ
jgi:Ulp1 family protease